MGPYSLTRAFQVVLITVTRPIGFLRLFWAALPGMMLFGEAPDPRVFIGGVIVVAVNDITHPARVVGRLKVAPPAVAI